MPGFTKNAFATPFGRNVYLRSTQDVKTDSYTVAAETVPATTIDGFAGQKVLQPGTVMAKITSGDNLGKIGPYRGEGGAGTNEAQTVTITGTPTGGTFTLTYSGETTTAIAYNAVAAAVQAALLALDAFDANDVVVTGGPGPGTPYVVTFADDFGGQNVDQMSATSSLTGGSTPAVAVTTTTPGVAGATDGRQTAANIVGICNTFLPWQLMERDVEIAVVYEASVVQANCLEYNAAGSVIALTNTTATAMVAQKTMDIKFR